MCRLVWESNHLHKLYGGFIHWQAFYCGSFQRYAKIAVFNNQKLPHIKILTIRPHITA